MHKGPTREQLIVHSYITVNYVVVLTSVLVKASGNTLCWSSEPTGNRKGRICAPEARVVKVMTGSRYLRGQNEES